MKPMPFLVAPHATHATVSADSKINRFLSLNADGVSRSSLILTCGKSTENQGSSNMRSSFNAQAGVGKRFSLEK